MFAVSRHHRASGAHPPSVCPSPDPRDRDGAEDPDEPGRPGVGPGVAAAGIPPAPERGHRSPQHPRAALGVGRKRLEMAAAGARRRANLARHSRGLFSRTPGSIRFVSAPPRAPRRGRRRGGCRRRLVTLLLKPITPSWGWGGMLRYSEERRSTAAKWLTKFLLGDFDEKASTPMPSNTRALFRPKQQKP